MANKTMQRTNASEPARLPDDRRLVRVLYGALFLSIFGSSLTFCSPAHGEPPRGYMDTGIRSTMTALDIWIAAHSDYERLAELPIPVFVDQDQLVFMAYGWAYQLSYPSVRGLFRPGFIFLPDDFVLHEDKAILLHELVHAHQHQAGDVVEWAVGDVATRCRIETEAVLLQNAYIQETGVGILHGPETFAWYCTP